MDNFIAAIRPTKKDIELLFSKNGKDFYFAIGFKNKREMRVIIDVLGKYIVGTGSCPNCYGSMLLTLDYCPNCGKELPSIIPKEK